jgi:uncharacterized protein YoxC
MDRDLRSMEEKELLQELVMAQRQGLRLRRVGTAALVILAIAFVVCLVILVPRVSQTLRLTESAFDTMQQTAQHLNSSLDALDAAGTELSKFTSENTETLGRFFELLGQIDLQGMTESIQKFNELAERLSSGFRLFG